MPDLTIGVPDLTIGIAGNSAQLSVFVVVPVVKGWEVVGWGICVSE